MAIIAVRDYRTRRDSFNRERVRLILKIIVKAPQAVKNSAMQREWFTVNNSTVGIGRRHKRSSPARITFGTTVKRF